MVATSIAQVMVMVSDREEMGDSLHLGEYVTLCVSVRVNAWDWHEASGTHFLSARCGRERRQPSPKRTCIVMNPSELVSQMNAQAGQDERAIKQIPCSLFDINGLE